MGAFKKIQVELIFLFIITFSLFISFNLDLSFYIYFKNFNENPNNIYLKNFFVEITRLGNSSWYFTLSIIGFGVFYLNNKFKIIQVSKTKQISNFFISSILYILAVGIITQAGKHIMGRPRPNYTDFENSVVFKFFTLESNFHSFPSGHSSTIFIVCLIISSVFPKLKYYFYFLGSIVALSRVVVGAHFFTDIVAGGLIALITFKLLNVLLEKKYTYYKFSNLVFINRSHFFYYILFLIISCLFVSAGPSLDLFISELFYLGKSQFMLQSYDLLSIFLRDIFLPLILVYILILPFVGMFAKIENIFFGYKFSFKEVILLWCSQIVSILIFVNLLLKNFWGRARPNDILQLGGDNMFSPWYEISNACQKNCSFVSGDASVGFSIIVLYLITKNIVFLYLSIFSGFVLGLIRIMAGGHFLSDVLFAGIFVVFLNIIIFEAYKRYYVR